MPLVSDYSSLLAHVTDTLDRPDLAPRVPNFVQQFEASARRGILTPSGPICLTERTRLAYQIGAEEQDLPPDCVQVEAWYYADHGPITLVSPVDLYSRSSDRSRPTRAARVGNRVMFEFAPPSPQPSILVYQRAFPPLSAASPVNRLLLDHPDIYLYGTLLESAPYLAHDERIGVWNDLLMSRLEGYRVAQDQHAVGGGTVYRFRPIGG